MAFSLHKEDSTIALAGPVADQAALHGLLMKLNNLGLTLFMNRVKV